MQIDQSAETTQGRGRASLGRQLLMWLVTSISLMAMAVVLVMIVEWAILPWWPELSIVTG